MLVAAGFHDIKITVKENGRDIVKDWIPGSGAENYVTSAYVTATKPRRAPRPQHGAFGQLPLRVAPLGPRREEVPLKLQLHLGEGPQSSLQLLPAREPARERLRLGTCEHTRLKADLLPTTLHQRTRISHRFTARTWPPLAGGSESTDEFVTIFGPESMPQVLKQS